MIVFSLFPSLREGMGRSNYISKLSKPRETFFTGIGCNCIVISINVIFIILMLTRLSGGTVAQNSSENLHNS